MDRTRGTGRVVVAACTALLFLPACSSTSESRGPKVGGPLSAGASQVPGSRGAPGGTATASAVGLPDPGLVSEGTSQEAQSASTVVNTSGTGSGPVPLPPLPAASNHLVIRLVCAGPGAGEVVTAGDDVLLRGSCAALTGASIDLPDVEARDFAEVTVRTGDATSWRLYLGAY